MPLKLFRSRVFNVANAMGFTIGMAMFGAIVFIPLYLQLVYGASPTSSGLRMLPLMAGLLVAAIASGRAISRIGRYKVFPIAGTAIARRRHVPALAPRRRHAPWLASVYMLVVGVGIGLVMQVLVLVVQNDARPEEIGVATSTATFFRSVGGSFGVAIFGAIFASRLARPDQPAAGLGCEAPRRRCPPDAGAGEAASARRARRVPAGVRALAPRRLPLGAALAVIPFVLSWFLQEVPLRTTLARPAELTPEAVG